MEGYSLIDKEQLERYTCSICLEIFSDPYIIGHCLHIFCLDCINKFIDYFMAKYGKIECPNCRAPFKKQDLIQDPSILKYIDNFIIKCECQKKVRLVHYNLHIRSNCRDFFELDQREIQRMMDSQPVQYTCPCCLSKGFTEQNLFTHVMNDHTLEEGICPICILKNKNEPKTMLAFHMGEFHSPNNQFQNEDNFSPLLGIPNLFPQRAPSYNEDEEMLRRAIEESLRK